MRTEEEIRKALEGWEKAKNEQFRLLIKRGIIKPTAKNLSEKVMEIFKKLSPEEVTILNNVDLSVIVSHYKWVLGEESGRTNKHIFVKKSTS